MSDLPIRKATQVRPAFSNKPPKKKALNWLREFFSKGPNKRTVHALREERDFVNLGVSAADEKGCRSKRSPLWPAVSQGASKVFAGIFPKKSTRIVPYAETTPRESSSDETGSVSDISESPLPAEGSNSTGTSSEVSSSPKEFIEEYDGMAFLASGKPQNKSSSPLEGSLDEKEPPELDYHITISGYDKLTSNDKKKAKILTVYVPVNCSQKEKEPFENKIKADKNNKSLPKECTFNYVELEQKELEEETRKGLMRATLTENV